MTLISAEDTTLKQGTPNANQGDDTSLRIQQGGINRALVRFDQQSLEQGIGNSGIRSAKLRLYITANGNNWGSDGREVNVHRLTQTWTEAGATWNCPNDTNTGNAARIAAQVGRWEAVVCRRLQSRPRTSFFTRITRRAGWSGFDPAIEKRIGNVPAEPLTSEESAELKEAVRLEVGSLPPTAQNPPVLLTSMDVRRVMRKLIEKDFPRLAVLSYQELSPDMNIQPIARISLS